MRILVACEFSGRVRDAFIARGHDAVSCDLLPTESPGPHIQGDVLAVLGDGWDMMIAHPPCTHLAVSGAQWFAEKRKDGRQQQGIDFFMAFAQTGIARVCIETPIGIMSTVWRKPDQIIQPYHFGHTAAKATCLWLANLPLLVPTDVVEPQWHISKTGKRHSQWDYDISRDKKNRAHLRSVTFQGIASAMAEQWAN